LIFYKTRNQIDINKYNACIKKAYNSRIYAYGWYLDCVTENWDVLILDDYKAVMPLPKRKKYGITYVYQPNLIQQLGVFSADKISEHLVDSFIKLMPKKIRLIDFYLNSENKTIHQKLTSRINYLLPLNKKYKDIYRDYNNNRKRSLRRALGTKFNIHKNGNLEAFLSIKPSNKALNKSSVTLRELECLIKQAVTLNYGEIWTVYDYDQKCIAGVCWMKNLDRLTYLYPVATDYAKSMGIPTLLIDEMIKTYANTNNFIDFEGSMVQGVAQFYQSFNAKQEEYFHLKKWLIF